MQRPFLSRPAARPMRFGKRSPATVTGSRTRACCHSAVQRRALEPRQRGQRQFVGVLGVEAEQERAGKRDRAMTGRH